MSEYRETIHPTTPGAGNFSGIRLSRTNEGDMTQSDLLTQTHWTEHPDRALPEGLLEIGDGGTISVELTGLKVRLSTQVYPDGREEHFHSQLGDTLLQVFEKAAHSLDEPLLPPSPATPLDYFRMRMHDGTWSDPINDLSLPLWKALAEGFSRHTSVEYRLEVRINTKWEVATSPRMTPRALLAEFGFDPAQFSLYRRESSEPLPPDAPIDLVRGEHFEAQKDGRYGGVISPLPVRGFQTIANDVGNLRNDGADVTVHNFNGQVYAEARGLSIPSPPWSTSTASILIAVPATYPQGALDGFYLESGPTQNGVVPRQQSTIMLFDRTWILISWHYATNRPWNPSADDLGTHIEHCRGSRRSRLENQYHSDPFSTHGDFEEWTLRRGLAFDARRGAAGLSTSVGMTVSYRDSRMGSPFDFAQGRSAPHGQQQIPPGKARSE